MPDTTLDTAALRAQNPPLRSPRVTATLRVLALLLLVGGAVSVTLAVA